MSQLQSLVYRIAMLFSIFFLIFAAVGCGTVTTRSAQVHNISVHPVGTGIADANGLHIQASTVFSCDHEIPFALAADRLTYDTGEINQMTAYLDAHWGSSSANANPPFPGTFTDLSLFDGSAPPLRCNWDLQITNTGTDQVQISQADVHMASITALSNHYHLVDVCSLIQCHTQGGNPTGCGDYSALFDLSTNPKVGDVYSSPIAVPTEYGNACKGAPIIAPGASIELSIYLMLEISPGNVSYSLVPGLNLSTSTATSHLTLTSMTGTPKFATSDRLLCYGWAGSAFVLENRNSDLDPRIIDRPSHDSTCL